MEYGKSDPWFFGDKLYTSKFTTPLRGFAMTVRLSFINNNVINCEHFVLILITDWNVCVVSIIGLGI